MGSIYSSVILFGYLSCPRVHIFSRSSNNLPNLAFLEPTSKAQASDDSLGTNWSLVVFYLFASEIAMGRYHPNNSKYTTPILIPNLPPLCVDHINVVFELLVVVSYWGVLVFSVCVQAHIALMDVLRWVFYWLKVEHNGIDVPHQEYGVADALC